MWEQPETEAQEWVQQAKAFYQAVGKDVAMAEFSHNGMFVQDQLYIYVLSSAGKMLAHGINDKFVGIDFSGVKDSNGKAFIKEILDLANSKGSGWVEYIWYHPRRKLALPKMAYFEKIDDVIICSAVYKEEA